MIFYNSGVTIVGIIPKEENEMPKKALITGVDGQIGSYLAESLLNKGYEVFGMLRRTSNYVLPNIEHIQDKINIVYGDLDVDNHLSALLYDIKPDELYNMAAQSDVRISFDIPEYTCDVTGVGVLRLLEAIRKFSPNTRMYQSSTSEMFGSTPAPQNEQSIMLPNNPYACAKLLGHNLCRVYREAYGLFVSCGILFNNESPRRGLNFVTRKIAHNIALIKKGSIKIFSLGNLDAKRDWGYSPEYVEIIWKILQQEKPDDFVVGTGEAHTIREFVEEAFKVAGLEQWEKYVTIDQNLKRARETNYLCADSSKARRELGWNPRVKFREIVKIMVEAEINQTI